MTNNLDATLREKIDFLKTSKKMFSNHLVFTIDIKKLIASLKPDEILDPLFEDELLPLVTFIPDKEEGICSFISAMSRPYMIEYVWSLNESERDLIFTKYFAYLKKKREYIKERDLSNYFSEGMVKENYQIKFLINIIDNDLLSLFSGTVIIKKCANKAMSAGSPQDIEKIFKSFKTDDILKNSYVGYPLVLMNSNLQKEEKVAMIKKTFIQKNIKEYTKFISDNLKDLNDLDDFLEATIFQNNRIREKERAFLDLIKRVFIGLRGTFYSYTHAERFDKKMRAIENKDAFATKYRHIFTRGNITELMSNLSWNQKLEAARFFSSLFANQPFKYKLEISIGCRDIGERLIDSKSPEPPKDVESEEDVILFYEYLLKYSSLQSLLEADRKSVLYYFKKFPNIFIGAFKETVSFQNTMTGYYGYGRISTEVPRHKIDNMISLINEIPPKNISLFKLFSGEFLDNLGFYRVQSSWNEENVAHNANRFFKTTIPVFEEIITKEYLKKALYDEYLIKFKDENHLSDLVLNISRKLNETKILKAFLTITGTTDIFSALNCINIFTNFIENNYKEYDTKDIISGLMTLKTNLSVICSL